MMAAFSPPRFFAAWRVEAPLSAASLFRWVLHVLLSLTRSVIVYDAAYCSRGSREFNSNQAILRIGHGRSFTVLKRVVNWNGDGFTEVDTETDQHAELEWRTGALTPGGKDTGKDDRDIDCELQYSDSKLAQSAAGFKQCSSLDRPYIDYGVKTASTVLIRSHFGSRAISVQVNIVAVSAHVFHRFFVGVLFFVSTHFCSSFMSQPRVVVDASGTPVPNSPTQLSSSNFGSLLGSGSDLDGMGTRSGSTTIAQILAITICMSRMDSHIHISRKHLGMLRPGLLGSNRT